MKRQYLVGINGFQCKNTVIIVKYTEHMLYKNQLIYLWYNLCAGKNLLLIVTCHEYSIRTCWSCSTHSGVSFFIAPIYPTQKLSFALRAGVLWLVQFLHKPLFIEALLKPFYFRILKIRIIYGNADNAKQVITPFHIT